MKSYGENPAPTTPRPSNNVEPPEKVSRVTMGGKTFPLAKSTEQVRQSIRKRYNIAELVANTPPEFLKDAWDEKAPDCPVCGDGIILWDSNNWSEYCSECGTVLHAPKKQEENKVNHQQRVAYAHEALDRIHVVQTLLSSILVDGEAHEGLCDNATNALNNVTDMLREAYVLQSECLFDLLENRGEIE